MNLKQMLEKAVYRDGGKTAIVSGELRLSYRELDEASDRFADALIRTGVTRGERVALLLSNSPEFVIIFFGIIKAGATAVPLDPQYKLEEFASLVSDCQPAVLISESSALEPLAPFLSRFSSIRCVIDLNSDGSGGFLGYKEIMAEASSKRIDAEPAPDDTALILYTSGPSFSPKGVMLSHRELVKETKVMGDTFRQTENDVVMLYALPMYHVFGLVAVLLTSMARNSTVVMVPGTGLSIGSFMAAIEREEGTLFFGVPYIFALVVELAEKEGIKNDLSSLRLCSSSADFLPVGLIERFEKLFCFKILDCFALTEAVCHVTCPPIDGSGKLGSVGKALPGWEIKVVDDDDRELPANQAGEIILKGTFMSGYYNNPRATAEAIKNGWLHTGDIGKMDDDGNLYIVGRKKDIIIVKGQNIHPSDVETVLYQHSDVAGAVVIGIPDEMRGEVVGAVVSLKPGSVATEVDIKHWCLERLASYKVPKQFFFFDSLPLSSAAQIDRESIRRRLSKSSSLRRVVF